MSKVEYESPEKLLKEAWKSGEGVDLDYAFRVFFSAYKSLVAFSLSRYFSKEEDVDEVLNETFATFFTHLDDFFRKEKHSYPKAYLLKIARNKAIDRLRKDSSWNDKIDCDLLSSPTPNRSYEAIREDLRLFLDEQETDIVVLVLQGYSAKEIGHMLHLTRSNVSVKYSRALAKLRERKEDFA